MTIGKNTLRAATAAGLAMFTSTAAVRAHETNAASAELKPKSIWDVSVALGFTLTKGNSDTALFTGTALAQRKKNDYELSLGMDGAYGENASVKNTESLHAFGQFNHLFTERSYFYARLDGAHDAIADLDYRVSFNVGVGHYLIKQTNTTLSVETGPGVTYEQLSGEGQAYCTLRFAEKFEHKINDHVKIWQSVEVQPQVDRWKNFVVNAEIGVESNFTKKSSLRVYLQDTYDNEPAPGRKANDLKLVTALAYKF